MWIEIQHGRLKKKLLLKNITEKVREKVNEKKVEKIEEKQISKLP